MADIKVITSTLLAEHNTIQITDSMINNNTIFEVYVNNPDIVCNNIVVGGTTANITFDTKPEENTDVKVMLNNTNGNFSVNASDVIDGTTTQNAINNNVSNSINTLSNNKVDSSTLNERVPNETVIGGVLYHGTTGNEWKRLTGSNVDYDDNTTINAKINSKQNTLTAGENITIENDVISASGGGTSIEVYDGVERVIGTWFGEPLYRKVFTYTGSASNVNPSTWFNTGVEFENKNPVRASMIILGTGDRYVVYPIMADFVSPLAIMHTRSIGITINTNSMFVVEYTKVGD